MIAEAWEHIKELFETALDCSPERRKSLLDQLRHDDPAAADELERLLAAYEKAGDFLLQPCCVASDFLEDLEVEEQRFFPGDVLCERFRIVHLIGRGGMGEVYKAWDEELEDHVALKVLRLEISTHELFTSRFRREIQLARKVTHPNVCRIFDSFKHAVGDGTYISVLSMELLQGETLADYLKAKVRLTAAEALPIVQQIIAGLNAIHAAGIVHRDLKPSNLVLVPESTAARTYITKGTPVSGGLGETEGVDRPDQGNGAADRAGDGKETFLLKITDFGIAGRLPDGLSPAAQTEASRLMGTPDYMAPEQLEHARASVQSDIYSLGLVLYEMVTGTKPFAGSSPWKRLYDRVPSLNRAATDINVSWKSAIHCCLEKDPRKRPSSASMVLNLLDSRPVRKWPRNAAAAIVIGMLIMVGASRLRLHTTNPNEPSSALTQHVVNPDAQSSVDLARIAIENLSQDGFAKAISEYKRAIELDPNWALPWAELAYAYPAASNARYVDGKTALSEARKAASRAIELDPGLAKAHGALAWTKSLDFDEWPEAEESFRTALQLNPDDGQIHYWFGVHLRKKGRFKEAEQHDQLALRLTHQRDPNIWCELAFLYWTSGQVPKLHRHLQEQLKTFRNFALTQYMYARLLKIERRFREAEGALAFAQKLDFNPLTILAERASLEEYAGKTAAARRDIAALVKASRTNEVDGLLLAGAYAGLQENDAAFAVLENAYQRKDNTLLSLATSPLLQPLRKDPRFPSLLRRLHFSDQIMQQIGFN